MLEVTQTLKDFSNDPVATSYFQIPQFSFLKPSPSLPATG